MNDMLAIILAGGRGKRMDILCQQRPKPTLPFAGKFRVIDFTLSNCINSRIDNIAVLVDYQRDVMTEYIGNWSSANHQNGRVAVLPPLSGSYKGTGDAVYQNLNFPLLKERENLLVLAGDHIYNMDYRKMLAYHEEIQADITVGLVRVPSREAHRFGTANIRSDGRIIDFVEKSSTPISNLASMGIYIFKRSYLEDRLREDAHDPNSVHDFGYAILPASIRNDRVYGYEYEGYWRDIGTVESYYEANMQLLNEGAAFGIQDTRHVLGCMEGMVSSFTGSSNRIANSLVGPGCEVEGYVENSVLSPGVRVGKKARILNSIVMADSSIGDYSVVERCILDEGVNIGQFCNLGFGMAPESRISDITLIGKDVNLGSQTSIGSRSTVLPGLRLDASTHRFVAPGTVVSVSG